MINFLKKLFVNFITAIFRPLSSHFQMSEISLRSMTLWRRSCKITKHIYRFAPFLYKALNVSLNMAGMMHPSWSLSVDISKAIVSCVEKLVKEFCCTCSIFKWTKRQLWSINVHQTYLFSSSTLDSSQYLFSNFCSRCYRFVETIIKINET